MANNFPNLKKDMILETQEAQQNPRRINILRHIIIILSKESSKREAADKRYTIDSQ